MQPLKPHLPGFFSFCNNLLLSSNFRAHISMSDVLVLRQFNLTPLKDGAYKYNGPSFQD